MKTKKLLSLLLASLMTCGMFACGGTDTSSESAPDGSPSTESTQTGGDSTTSEETTSTDDATSEELGPVEKTDDELFALLKEGVAATEAYTGAITASATMNNTQTMGEETNSSTATAKMSYDPESKLSYSTETSVDVYGGETETDTDTEKLFKVDDTYYYYDKEETTPANEWNNYETYTKLHARSDYFNTEEDADMSYLTSMIAGGTFLADTYTELTSAYDTVYPAAIANSLAQAGEDFNAEEGDLMTATPTLAISEEEGVVSLSISSLIEATDMGEDGSQIAKILISRLISVSNGMVTGVSIAYSVEMTSISAPEDSQEPISSTMKAEMAMSYAIEYVFDQAGYDAIPVTLPAEEEISEEVNDYSKYITIMLGDIAMEQYIYSYAEEPSYADALSSISSDIEQNFSDGWWDENGEYTETQLLDIEGLYLDKELTKPLDPTTMTEDEYYALETVYAKYTLTDGYFMYCSDSEETEQLSKAYQIVMIGGLFGMSDSMSMPQIELAQNYSDGYSLACDEGETAWINGVQTEESSFVPVAGTTYYIVYKSVKTDADVTLLDLIGGMMMM